MAGLRLYGTVEYDLALNDDSYAKLHLKAAEQGIKIIYHGKKNGYNKATFILENQLLERPKSIKKFDDRCFEIGDSVYSEEIAHDTLANLLRDNLNEQNKGATLINRIKDLRLYKFKTFYDENGISNAFDVYELGILFNEDDLIENRIISLLSSKARVPGFVKEFINDPYLQKAFDILIGNLNSKRKDEVLRHVYEKIKEPYLPLEIKIEDVYFKKLDLLDADKPTNEFDLEVFEATVVKSIENGMKNLLRDMFKSSSSYSFKRHIVTKYIKSNFRLIPSKVELDCKKENGFVEEKTRA